MADIASGFVTPAEGLLQGFRGAVKNYDTISRVGLLKRQQAVQEQQVANQQAEAESRKQERIFNESLTVFKDKDAPGTTKVRLWNNSFLPAAKALLPESQFAPIDQWNPEYNRLAAQAVGIVKNEEFTKPQRKQMLMDLVSEVSSPADLDLLERTAALGGLDDKSRPASAPIDREVLRMMQLQLQRDLTPREKQYLEGLENYKKTSGFDFGSFLGNVGQGQTTNKSNAVRGRYGLPQK